MYLLTRFSSQLKGESGASIINALTPSTPYGLRHREAARSQNAAGVENQIGVGRPTERRRWP